MKNDIAKSYSKRSLKLRNKIRNSLLNISYQEKQIYLVNTFTCINHMNPNDIVYNFEKINYEAKIDKKLDDFFHNLNKSSIHSNPKELDLNDSFYERKKTVSRKKLEHTMEAIFGYNNYSKEESKKIEQTQEISNYIDKIVQEDKSLIFLGQKEKEKSIIDKNMVRLRKACKMPQLVPKEAIVQTETEFKIDINFFESKELILDNSNEKYIRSSNNLNLIDNVSFKKNFHINELIPISKTTDLNICQIQNNEKFDYDEEYLENIIKNRFIKQKTFNDCSKKNKYNCDDMQKSNSKNNKTSNNETVITKKASYRKTTIKNNNLSTLIYNKIISNNKNLNQEILTKELKNLGNKNEKSLPNSENDDVFIEEEYFSSPGPAMHEHIEDESSSIPYLSDHIKENNAKPTDTDKINKQVT